MTRAGIVLVGLVLLGGLFGPMLLPLDPVTQELPLRLAAPSLAHPFGLDELGRDILARLLAGARISLLVGLVVVSVSVVVGVTLGSIAGYFGGLVDDAISRVIDVLLAFPGLLLAIAMVAVLGPSLTNVVLALSLIGGNTADRYDRTITELRALAKDVESGRFARSPLCRWPEALHLDWLCCRAKHIFLSLRPLSERL